MPEDRYWLMRSISTMALVTTMPTSISMPMSAGTCAVPLSSRPMMAPVTASGIDTSSCPSIRLTCIGPSTVDTAATSGHR